MKIDFSTFTNKELEEKITALEKELAKATFIDAAKIELLVQLKNEVNKRK